MDFYDILFAKKLAGGGGSSITVNPLSVTENGTYTAEEGEAYSPVTVNVPNPSSGKLDITDTGVKDVSTYAQAQVVDADLVAQNIKKDVNILGIVGTFEGGSSDIPILHGRKLVAGTFVPAVDESTHKVSFDPTLGIPSGAAFWTEEDFYADTTTAWVVYGFCMYTDESNGYGFGGGSYKSSATATKLNGQTSGKTATAGQYLPVTSQTSGAYVVIYKYSSEGSVQFYAPYSRFKAGAEYKYILFF